MQRGRGARIAVGVDYLAYEAREELGLILSGTPQTKYHIAVIVQECVTCCPGRHSTG